ncbi:hypothetical protein L596_008830 [Steinernema carpocapsae]|uniref:Uncharacterized protein n=1 Tax=Steinernema carpocapsae TaxID=34508 RepID=A0A4U5PE55_STECR|nr:hypothetical protein L596_008830 [Steinernema carpocapsae]
MASLTDPVVLPPSPSPSERPPSSSPKKERSPVIKERRSLETPDVEEMARFAAKTVHHEYEEEKDSGPLERLPLFYTVHSIGNNTGITVEEAQEFEAHHKEPPGTLVMRVTMKALRIGHFDAHPGTMNAEEVKAAVSPDTKIEVKTPTPPNVGPPSPVHPIEAGEARSPGILASPARVEYLWDEDVLNLLRTSRLNLRNWPMTFPIVSESPASPARVTFPIVPRSPASPARGFIKAWFRIVLASNLHSTIARKWNCK